MKSRLSTTSTDLLPRLLDKLVPTRLFARLTIAKKILFGYMALVALTVIVVVYALVNLQRINILNKSIVKVDVVVEEASGKMLDALLAQDTYEKRFLILKSSDMKTLFFKRGKEFRSWLAVLKNLPVSNANTFPIETIDKLYSKYSDLFSKETQLVRKHAVEQAYAVSNGDLKNVLDKLTDTLRTLSASAKKAQDMKMKGISAIGGTAFLTTAVLCLFSIFLGAVAGLVVTHHISSSLHTLKEATEYIAEGDFNYDPHIATEDEIGTLSQAFLAMENASESWKRCISMQARSRACREESP